MNPLKQRSPKNTLWRAYINSGGMCEPPIRNGENIKWNRVNTERKPERRHRLIPRLNFYTNPGCIAALITLQRGALGRCSLFTPHPRFLPSLPMRW
jgi:hypothetical protein